MFLLKNQRVLLVVDGSVLNVKIEDKFKDSNSCAIFVTSKKFGPEAANSQGIIDGHPRNAEDIEDSKSNVADDGADGLWGV